MLNFACITPHPPIIIPTIGSSSDLEKVSKTIEGYKKLTKIFQRAKPEIVIVISPHGPVDYSQFSLVISPTLSGNFGMFGDFETEFEFKNNLEIIDLIAQSCKLKNIPYRLVDFPQLDHGVLVPLYYLLGYNTNKSPIEITNIPRIVPLAYSFLDRKTHFEFGKILWSIVKNQKSKVGIIASGDLSHRLSFDAPAGYSPYGEVFDRDLIEYLKKKEIDKILNMNPELIEKAGECGYLSTIILLGVISEIKKAKFQILSYEAPFGVGYLVANVKGL